MKWKAVVPIAIILVVLALALTACGPDIEETNRQGGPPRPRVDCNTK